MSTTNNLERKQSVSADSTICENPQYKQKKIYKLVAVEYKFAETNITWKKNFQKFFIDKTIETINI